MTLWVYGHKPVMALGDARDMLRLRDRSQALRECPLRHTHYACPTKVAALQRQLQECKQRVAFLEAVVKVAK